MRGVILHNGNRGEFRVWADGSVWYAYAAEFLPQGGHLEETEGFATRAEAWDWINAWMGPREKPAASLGERLGFQPINSRTHGYNGQEHR